MEYEILTFKINNNNKVTAELKSDYKDTGNRIITHELLDIGIFYADNSEYIDESMRRDSNFTYNYDPGMRIPWWVSFLPYVILFVAIFFIWNTMINRSGVGGDKGAMRFGKARTRLAGEEKKKVTFADVAGAEEEKEELREIVDFLKGPQKYTAIGARIPKGVLLIGPLGTG